MPDEAYLFETKGATWEERSKLSELAAVISGQEDLRLNSFLHGTSLYAAWLAGRTEPRYSRILDFGCGNGRILRYLAKRHSSLVGTEVTLGMLEAARQLGTPSTISLYHTDGVTIPEPNDSMDLIWCCGVLRYSLFVKNPRYKEIGEEMYRVLKPGGKVINVKMYVENEYETFTKPFEAIGFDVKQVSVLHRYGGKVERYFANRRLPRILLPWTGRVCAALRMMFDDASRSCGGLRDYFIVYQKPK